MKKTTLNIENLESEMFIAELGAVRGGHSERMPFGCGPADGPCAPEAPNPYAMLEEIMKDLPGGGVILPHRPVTSLALGEE